MSIQQVDIVKYGFSILQVETMSLCNMQCDFCGVWKACPFVATQQTGFQSGREAGFMQRTFTVSQNSKKSKIKLEAGLMLWIRRP